MYTSAIKNVGVWRILKGNKGTRIEELTDTKGTHLDLRAHCCGSVKNGIAERTIKNTGAPTTPPKMTDFLDKGIADYGSPFFFQDMVHIG